MEIVRFANVRGECWSDDRVGGVCVTREAILFFGGPCRCTLVDVIGRVRRREITAKWLVSRSRGDSDVLEFLLWAVFDAELGPRHFRRGRAV